MLKATLVFMIAGCCFGIGLWIGRKNKMIIFKNAILSTGLAILYADIVLMQSVWLFVPEYIAIGLFLIWCTFGILLSRYYNEKLFYWITLIGIAVTAFLLREGISYDLRGFVVSFIMIAAFIINCFLFIRQYEEGSPVFGLAAIGIFYSLGYHENDLNDKNVWYYKFLLSYQCFALHFLRIKLCIRQIKNKIYLQKYY